MREDNQTTIVNDFIHLFQQQSNFWWQLWGAKFFVTKPSSHQHFHAFLKDWKAFFLPVAVNSAQNLPKGQAVIVVIQENLKHDCLFQ